MASLRTAFIQAVNPTNRPFFSAIAYLPSFAQQATSSDDIKKQGKTSIPVEDHSQNKIQFFRLLSHFENSEFNIINRFMSMNINNFSHLLDKNLNDFKDCENLVHVMQLSEEEDQEFSIQELDTIQSVTLSADCSTRDGKIKQPSQSQKSSGTEEEEGEDFSQVEDF